MADPVFRLGTFADGNRPFVGLVLGDDVVEVAALHAAYAGSSRAKAGQLAASGSMLDLLADWPRSFAVLQAMAAFAAAEGAASERVRPAVRRFGDLRVLPPVLRPGKMLYAAANYREHVAEMRAARFTGGDFDKAKDAQGDKSRLRAYLFLKAPSCLAGAFDDIVLPAGEHRIDWEAELAVVIGRPGRNVPAEKALDHVAGFMTTNDVSCRDLTWREDRPTIRSDWLAGKSFDTFAPTGPFLVPREFVPNHASLRVWLAVNGVTKQDGNTGDMIFSTAEQIEYASRMLTLEPGDLFATGTPSGVGQGRGEFLEPGDVVECEVEGLGRQRNRVVQGHAEYSS
jgi:2,4-diketo-3-deoxy-L-fuconate hydrolase